MLKAIHICNRANTQAKIAKEYVFANAISRTENKARKHNNDPLNKLLCSSIIKIQRWSLPIRETEHNSR